jgi:hypothetical protein
MNWKRPLMLPNTSARSSRPSSLSTPRRRRNDVTNRYYCPCALI